jgi:hypothetical protein
MLIRKHRSSATLKRAIEREDLAKQGSETLLQMAMPYSCTPANKQTSVAKATSCWDGAPRPKQETVVIADRRRLAPWQRAWDVGGHTYDRMSDAPRDCDHVEGTRTTMIHLLPRTSEKYPNPAQPCPRSSCLLPPRRTAYELFRCRRSARHRPSRTDLHRSWKSGQAAVLEVASRSSLHQHPRRRRRRQSRLHFRNRHLER